MASYYYDYKSSDIYLFMMTDHYLSYIFYQVTYLCYE